MQMGVHGSQYSQYALGLNLYLGVGSFLCACIWLKHEEMMFQDSTCCNPVFYTES